LANAFNGLSVAMAGMAIFMDKRQVTARNRPAHVERWPFLQLKTGKPAIKTGHHRPKTGHRP
jgi:hypothetical protein